MKSIVLLSALFCGINAMLIANKWNDCKTCLYTAMTIELLKPYKSSLSESELEKLMCDEAEKKQSGAKQLCHSIAKEIKGDEELSKLNNKEFNKNPVMLDVCRKHLKKNYC
ncbi:hypothetical protein Aduo_002915 [Ancylostoma duodenale]